MSVNATTVLFGRHTVGYAVSAPKAADGTETVWIKN